MTIKKFPEKWNKKAIAEARALLQHYYNRPTTTETIQQYMQEITSLGYADDEVVRFLQFNGENMLRQLTETICNNFKVILRIYKIPPQTLYEPATIKAYDVFIPICERWVMQLKAEREQLKKEIAEKTATNPHA